MKYRGEADTYSGISVMLIMPSDSPVLAEKIADAITEHLKEQYARFVSPVPSFVPQGRIQYMARIDLTILPEFGMPQEGFYARVAGEFELPILDPEPK